MLTINQIRENKDEVIRLLKIKNFDASSIIEQILQIDLERRNLRQSLDNLQAEMNKGRKSIRSQSGKGKNRPDQGRNPSEKRGFFKSRIRSARIIGSASQYTQSFDRAGKICCR